MENDYDEMIEDGKGFWDDGVLKKKLGLARE